MITEEEVRRAAEVFAQALDQNDFDAVVGMLTPDCQYDRTTGTLESEGIIIGPAAIAASYKSHDEWARQHLDRVDYSSTVVSVKGRAATIRFEDDIEKAGRSHHY